MSEKKKNVNFFFLIWIFFILFFFLTLSWTIPTIFKKNFSNRPSSLATFHTNHTNNFKMYVCVHDNVAKLLGRFEKFFLQMVGMVQDSVRKEKNFKKNFFQNFLFFYFFYFFYFLKNSIFLTLSWTIPTICKKNF